MKQDPRGVFSLGPKCIALAVLPESRLCLLGLSLTGLLLSDKQEDWAAVRIFLPIEGSQQLEERAWVPPTP